MGTHIEVRLGYEGTNTFTPVLAEIQQFSPCILTSIILCVQTLFQPFQKL